MERLSHVGERLEGEVLGWAGGCFLERALSRPLNPWPLQEGWAVGRGRCFLCARAMIRRLPGTQACSSQPGSGSLRGHGCWLVGFVRHSPVPWILSYPEGAETQASGAAPQAVVAEPGSSPNMSVPRALP